MILFRTRMKHMATDATDVEYTCMVDEEAHIVEFDSKPNRLDTMLLLSFILRNFPLHGIDAVAEQKKYGNIDPPWKVFFRLDGILHRLEIVELPHTRTNKEYTLILRGAENPLCNRGKQ